MSCLVRELRTPPRGSLQRPDCLVGLALLESRCPGLLDTVEAALRRSPEVTRDQLLDSSDPTWARADVIAAIGWLEALQAVSARSGPPRRTSAYRALQPLGGVLQDAKLLAEALPAFRAHGSHEGGPTLAVSWPASLPRPQKAVWRDSRAAMVELLDSSATDATLLFPFVDEAGAAEISAALERALSRGVAVTLLTRYLQVSGSANSRLVERLSRVRGEAVHFRAFSLAAADDSGGRELLHAKVIAVDGGRSGYIGSANLTEAALDESFEVGLIVDASVAMSLKQLLDELLSFARPA